METLALIAHDNCKPLMAEWASKHKEELSHFALVGTGHTSKIVEEATGLKVKAYLPGPMGGDQQIGSHIADGTIKYVVFLIDPLSAQPHDPDVKALLRIASVYDIAIATTAKTADLMIKGAMESDWSHQY